MKRLVLIDGKSVFYRGYYAMGGLKTEGGTLVGGVYGFAAMALEVIRKLEPDFVAVAWDKAGTNIRRRREIYPEYKAGRVKAPDDFYAQVPILHELLNCFGWPLYELDDFEADDIIGTLAQQAEETCSLETIIISSDLDMLQVVGDRTHLYALKKGFTDIEKFDITALEVKYGISKEQFLDLKALKGDSSDNIPGVPGIGEKTATALLQEYGTLDQIYENIALVKSAWARKLEEGKGSAYMSKKLAELVLDAPIELDLVAMDVRRLDAGRLRTELDKLEFRSLIRRLPDYMREDKAISNAASQNTVATNNVPAEFEIIRNDAEQIALVSKGCFIAHDVKKFFENWAEPTIKSLRDIELFDTRLAGFLLNSLRKASDIEDETAEKIYALYVDRKEKLVALPKLYKLACKIDFPLQILLAKIESRGVELDLKILAKMSKKLHKKVGELEQEIWLAAGKEFNIASPLQLSEILFQTLNLPNKGVKKTARGFSTGANELEKLRGLNPIIELIEKYRELTKILSTYVDALPKLAGESNRLHTKFQQDITQTGRLSSSEPNLQNIPARTELGREIRTAFVARNNKLIVNADYSQFELRLAAALAGDTNLIEDFQDDDIDIHTKTAAEAFGRAMEDVSEAERRAAKVINFGVLYGMSPRGLSQAADMSMVEAKDFIYRYFRLRQPIRDLINKTVHQAEIEGYVETLFGRRRLTPDVKSPVYVVREAAKRAAANMPIQGTEADLMKMAMLRIEREIPEAEQFMQIHDSIMVECDPQAAEMVGKKMKQIMENIYPSIGVRLKVDIKIGKNWSEL
ncbi:DNA polymerase [Candidatus Saccharibacteria bacterium]|nr:DNA polymerase [Candidatus Saccharibacteria bacterium]